ARVGHCQAPNTKTPLTERGFLLPEILHLAQHLSFWVSCESFFFAIFVCVFRSFQTVSVGWGYTWDAA
ncbi:hypothetical protein, partial [Aeromonas enteropelogenes]|uniref:hypothetical protein n=1 Tax=Aeromonas enteropelogenes TaxID=29489 RepID=UPI003B9EEAF3